MALASGVVRASSIAVMRAVGVWARLETAVSKAAQKAGSSATEVRWPWMVKLRLVRWFMGELGAAGG